MITKHLKAICDECNSNFKLKSKMIKEEKVTDSVLRMYYKCPKCKHKYIVGYKDEEIDNNIEEIQRIREAAKNIHKISIEDVQSAANQYAEHCDILKQRNRELNSRYKAIYGR